MPCYIRQTDGSEFQVAEEASEVASRLVMRTSFALLTFGPLAVLTGQKVYVKSSEVVRIF